MTTLTGDLSAPTRPLAEAEDVRPTRRRLGPGEPIRFGGLIGIVVLLAAWVVGSATGVLDPRTLTEPWTVLQTAGTLIESGRLQESLVTSGIRAALGLCLGVVAGTVLAVISGLSRVGESLIDGPIQVKRSIPTLALIPLLILWLGIGEPMKVITIALAVFVPIYIHTHNGLRTIEGRYAELAETLGVSRSEFVRHVVLPGAMPGFLLGLRFAVTSALLGAGRGRGHQRHERDRPHDHARVQLRTDRHHRRRPGRLRAARRHRRRGRPTDREEGTVMASYAGELSPAVRVTSLHRSFNEAGGVLNGLDLDIAPGEFVALLGRSGSGKSTLLRALAGLDRGVAGTGVIEVPEKVSVVFQDSRLLPWKRVLDNVTLGLRAGDASDRGRQALAEVGLAGREKAWPHELSGGEQQRASLARSLVRDPQLLLADEPFGALDALTRIRMHTLLRKLCEVHQPAVLLVTHDVDEAIVLADRVIVLDGGVVRHDARVELDGRRSQADPAFARLRAQLLTELGVEDDHDAVPARHLDRHLDRASERAAS